MFDQKDVIKQIISYEIELTSGEIISVSKESIANMFVNQDLNVFIVDKGILYTRYRDSNTPWLKIEINWQSCNLTELFILFITDVAKGYTCLNDTDAVTFWEFSKWLVKGGRYLREKEI